MEYLLTVKMLKPYYIKTDANQIRVVLAYQYFAIFIHNEVYQFIPTDAKEIRINRRTQKIINVDARFAFQKGKNIIYIPMTELISLPDFLIQLYSIVETYYANGHIEKHDEDSHEIDIVIDELERLNIKRLIDRSLDERDEATFQSLVKLL